MYAARHHPVIRTASSFTGMMVLCSPRRWVIRRIGRTVVSDWNSKIIEEFRANGGKVGGNFEGAPLLLLHSVGAKSGQVRVNPMMYLPDDHRFFVFASKAGAPTNPDWYHNLKANPRAKIEIGTDLLEVQATEIHGEQRDAIYAGQASRYPGFADYEKQTDRVIPVFALTPVA
jgi:deazaflavin-dependent oxidoreductase (nitroreductase family)